MKQVKKSLSKIAAVMLIAAMLIQPFGVQETKAENSTYGIDNPVITSTDTTWDSIYFGTYNNEKIRWRVLCVNEEDAFLFSESILDVQPFHDQEDTDVSWKTSSLRTWLNSTFLDEAFTEAEKNQIVKYPFEDNEKPEYTTGSFDSVVVDRVSLPSVREVSMQKYGFESKYSTASVTRESETGSGRWWLRTNGYYSGLISDVAEDGHGYVGIPIWDDSKGEARTSGIRPVIHLNLNGAVFENAGSIKKAVERSNTDAPTASPDATPASSDDFEDDEEEIPQGYTAINSIDDLAGIRNDLKGKYILTKDIDLSETKSGGTYDSGNGWSPIKDFAGVLDGNGHKIKGMHIFGEMEGGTSYGLFANLKGDAVVERLGMTGVDIDITVNGSGYLYAGAIAGGSIGTISECYVDGKIAVNGYGEAGGIAGDCDPGQSSYTATIKDCYNMSDVYVAKGTAGGICARARMNERVRNCYNMGDINQGEEKGGAIVGICFDTVVVSDCLYLVGSAKKDSKGTPLTEKQMQDLNWYTNFDFIDVWDIDSNSGILYPQLKKCPQVRLKGIKITQNPAKVEYNQGDRISLRGGEIVLQYENGKTTVVAMDETMLGNYDMMKIGNQTIEIKRLNKTASFTINVNPIPVERIALDKTQLVLEKGKTDTLTAMISPENATYKDVIWSSKDSSIARIDQNGKVTAVNPGNTVIEAKSQSTGDVTTTCDVSVIIACDSLTITTETSWNDDTGVITLDLGNTLQLKCDVSPADATETIMWRSENPLVAIVNAQGCVTAVGAGTTRIIVRSSPFGKTDSISICVRGTTPTPTPAPVVPDQEESETDTDTTNHSLPVYTTEIPVKVQTVVRPGNTSIKKIKKVKKQLQIQWRKAKNARYYEVQVATNRSFTKGLKGGTLTGLKGWCKVKRKKTYYVRVRAISSTGLVGKWSKVKKIKCK